MKPHARRRGRIILVAAACAMCATGAALRAQREHARVLQGTLYVAGSRYCPGDAQTDVLQLRLRLVVQNVGRIPTNGLPLYLDPDRVLSDCGD